MTGIVTYTLEITKCLVSTRGNSYDYEGQVFDFMGRNQAVTSVQSYFSDVSASSKDTGNNLLIRVCKLFPLGAYIRAGALSRILSYQQLLHSKATTTVFFNYLRPNRVKGETIITVYDMVSERFPDTMDKTNRRLLHRFLLKSCRKASAIITISEFSKQEIVDCLGIPPAKIHVAPCGIDNKVYFPIKDHGEEIAAANYLKEKYKLSSPYILYLGTLEPRKNVDVILDAFLLLHTRFPELRLVICGGLGWKYESTLERITSLGMDEFVIRTGYVSESDKRIFYIGAEAFVFPSIYEGFGLPVAEAMACGTPVICSNSSSLPEVAGNAGILCDPNDAKSFAAAVEQIITDRALREELKQRMKSQIQSYTWERAAKVYSQVIADVVKSHG